MTTEYSILHETANLSLHRFKGGLELRLSGHTHAVVVGKPKSLEAARKTMERLERYPKNLRAMLNHH